MNAHTQTPLERDAKRCNARWRVAGWLDKGHGAAERAPATKKKATPLCDNILWAIAYGDTTPAQVAVTVERTYDNAQAAMARMARATPPLLSRSERQPGGFVHYALTDAGRARMAELEDSQ